MYSDGPGIVDKHWQLKLPLLMATGRKDNKSAVTSSFPADLFDQGWHESSGSGSRRKRMHLRGFDAIVPGESTIVILHEQDLGLVHHCMVTCGPDGRLQVRSPAAAAREAGDNAAANTWVRGFPAAGPRQHRLLDVAAVEKLLAATTRLTQRKNRGMYDLERFLKDCTAAASEAERQPPRAATPEDDEDTAAKMEQEDAELIEQEGAEVKKEGQGVERGRSFKV